MITHKDVQAVVHAIQAADIRGDLEVCVVLRDGDSLGAFAPDGTDKAALLLDAAARYNKQPDAQFDVHPKDDR